MVNALFERQLERQAGRERQPTIRLVLARARALGVALTPIEGAMVGWYRNELRYKPWAVRGWHKRRCGIPIGDRRRTVGRCVGRRYRRRRERSLGSIGVALASIGFAPMRRRLRESRCQYWSV